MKKKTLSGLVYLAPIAMSILFGGFCGYLILSSSVEAILVTPFSEGTFGSLANAAYFVILVAVGATLLYLLLKRRSKRLIALITGFAMTAAVFMLSFFYLFAALSHFDIPYPDVLILAASALITVVADYAIFRSKSRLSGLVVLVIGGGLGTFLGFSIPTQSAVLILGFLAIYDAFAVYRGPVGKIARSGIEQFRGLSFSFKDIQMGLGDLTFYSMLSGHMLIYFGYFSFVAAVLGILVGCLLSFRMLEKKGMFPGLPFPVIFGLTAGLLAGLAPFA